MLRFVTADYGGLVMIALPALLAVLSFCAIYSSLRRRGAKQAGFVALAAAWAIGVVSLVASVAVGRPAFTLRQLLEPWLPVSLAVLLPLLFAASLYRWLVSKSVTVAVGLAAIVGVAVSPVCWIVGVLASCLTGIGTCPK